MMVQYLASLHIVSDKLQPFSTLAFPNLALTTPQVPLERYTLHSLDEKSAPQYYC